MPKKKGGKKKSSKSKKSKEPEMTTEEAILAYKVSIHEKHLEERKYILQSVLEENTHLRERNKALLEEQEKLLAVLHQEAAKFEVKEREATKTDKEEVVNAMKDKWASEKAEIDEINNIRAQIKQAVRRMHECRHEIKVWKAYRDDTLPKQNTQIKLYEQELHDLEVTFEDVSHHLERNLLINKRKIDQHKEKAIVYEKEAAANKASTIIDRDTKRELADNLWLKDEVALHTKYLAMMKEEVHNLETQNLGILAQLFDCQREDLQISPRLFMTQFEDHENLQVSARLQYDLEEIRRPAAGEFFLPDERKRPKSAVLKAVERKLEETSMKVEGRHRADENQEQEHEVLVAMPFKTGEAQSSSRPSSSHTLTDDRRALELLRKSNKLNDALEFFTGDGDADRFDETLAERVVQESKGGPLEFKLLNIVGRRLALVDPDADTADILEEERRKIKWRKDDWKIGGSAKFGQ